MSKKTVRIGIGAFLLIIGSLFYLMNMYTPICGDDYLYSFYLTPVSYTHLTLPTILRV